MISLFCSAVFWGRYVTVDRKSQHKNNRIAYTDAESTNMSSIFSVSFFTSVVEMKKMKII